VVIYSGGAIWPGQDPTYCLLASEVLGVQTVRIRCPIRISPRTRWDREIPGRIRESIAKCSGGREKRILLRNFEMLEANPNGMVIRMGRSF
jgi:hypothetical protein